MFKKKVNELVDPIEDMEKTTIKKVDITKIKKCPDVDIVYTNNRFYICKKGSIEDWGQVIVVKMASKNEDDRGER